MEKHSQKIMTTMKIKSTTIHLYVSENLCTTSLRTAEQNMQIKTTNSHSETLKCEKK